MWIRQLLNFEFLDQIKSTFRVLGSFKAYDSRLNFVKMFHKQNRNNSFKFNTELIDYFWTRPCNPFLSAGISVCFSLGVNSSQRQCRNLTFGMI